NKPGIRLLQNNIILSVGEPTNANGTWKIQYQYRAKIQTAKFQCEVKNDVSKKTTDREIKCSASTANKSICHGGLEEICSTGVLSQESPKNTSSDSSYAGPLDIVLIGSIAGGAVVFVIFLALLIYCIRKKRAERYEEQDEETPMKIRQVKDESKYRELPQPPGHAPPKQPHQQQRPPPQAQTQYQGGPPRPRPRAQQKSPSHMKERP
ncbi:CD2 molecule, partial [Chelydra serpentina]